jgi:hypothetical protein
MDKYQSNHIIFSNKLFNIFKIITILFVIALSGLPIISYLKDNLDVQTNFPFFKTLFKGMILDFDFPIWFYFLYWFCTIVVFAIPIYLLIFCFGNTFYWNTLLSNKKVAITFYILLVIFALLSFFIAYSELDEHFFNSNRGNEVVNNVFNFIFPKTDSENQLAFYRKTEAVLFAIISAFNIYFMATFWKHYKIKANYEVNGFYDNV